MLHLDPYNSDQEKINRVVQVLSRQTPIRCLLYIRIMRATVSAFRPLSECTVHVLLLIAVGAVAYKLYSRRHISMVAGPRGRKPLDLIGAWNHKCLMIYLRYQRPDMHKSSGLHRSRNDCSSLCRYGAWATVLLGHRARHHFGGH